MNPQTPGCHNPQCPASGPRGRGNMQVHSRAEQRYRCPTCGQTFAATTATPFDRLRPAAEMVTLVLTLRSPGCPTQAIVAALGVDARTVAAGLSRAGQPCQRVHQPVVQQGQVDLPPVQADALWVQLVGRRVWRAMALAVPSRRWRGGVLSPHRDLRLITALVQVVRSCARHLALLVCVEGLASAVTAFPRGFRNPGRTGHRGRPRGGEEPGLLLGHVVKRDVQRRVASVDHRVVRGTDAALVAVLAATRSGTRIKTASIERLHATWRASLAPLMRRGRASAPTETGLSAGRWLVGWAYNFCWLPQSLRVAAPAGAPWTWQERPPAMAAGLTNHRWTRLELLPSHVPLPAWGAPKRRGRPPKPAFQPVTAVAA